MTRRGFSIETGHLRYFTATSEKKVAFEKLDALSEYMNRQSVVTLKIMSVYRCFITITGVSAGH